ncbi:MFS transporter [Kribbella sp. NPDC059898]|uniref:MFS transporter n=1 Tax=Kribbella sp. NPDC059898 TaxID=3346995 RepID=UPI00365B7EB8
MSRRLVLALTCVSQFMVILDASIVNVALPSIQRDLGFTGTGPAWIVNGYLLTFAGFLLLGGRAADLLGRRRMLVAGLVLFSAASLAAGLAGTPTVLVTARIVQGVGAALLAPATLAVLNTTFTEPRDRARAFGAWSAAGGVGGMAGALAGGAITTGLSWRWVFLINVPIGLALITAALASLPAGRLVRRESLDVAGAVMATGGLAAAIYGVMQSADHGWTSARVAVPVLVGVVVLVLFVVVEARVAVQPMLPLRLFGSRRVAVGTAMLLLFGGIAIAMWYFTSLYLQNVLGYSALRSGLAQTPAAVAFVVVARVASALLPRVGVRALIVGGAVLFLAGFGWLSQAGGYLSGVLPPMLLVAAGIGLMFPTLMATVTTGVDPADAGIVGGLANTASQVGSSVGLAVLTTVGAGGYDRVFLVAAALGPAIALVSALLPRRD